MGRIEWVRAAQFNWVLDNMGGAPLQEAVAGNWQGAAAEVQSDGGLTLTAPNPGGGQVYYVRGVYRAETVFPWNGFWVEPMSGDPTNYYQGGSFSNRAGATLITLGTPLPAGTPVQLYYIYNTGETAAKYEPLNNYPCLRRASRGRDDYTYDFAVDRLLDLMTFLHLAGPAQGKDYGALIRFLWRAYAGRAESRQAPLMQDSFERQLWDRGPHLMYRGATPGGAFTIFQCAAAGQAGRALHVKAQLPASTDAAWFGYGLDWELTAPPFDGIDRLSFKLQGPANTRRLHNLAKTGSGSAVLVLQGDYTRQEQRTFVVQIESTGAVGEATFKWSKDGGVTWEAGGLLSGDREHPVDLWAGLAVYWEGGAGTDLVAGDYWTFWAGEPALHPRRLLVSLNDSTPDAPDPWDPAHTYVHAAPDRFAELTGFEAPFSQFWRLDNIIDDADRVSATWGAWYSVSQPELSDITIDTREVTEVVAGETFYSQRLVTWDLSPNTTAFGVWAAIDPARCDSSGQTEVNFLIRAVVSGISNLTLRVKLKDAQGSYFYRDLTVPANVWQRVSVALADLQLESGTLPLTHPCQAIDVGIPAAPPSNGAFYLTDLKFGEHRTFAGAVRLRTVEFKLEQQGLEEHEWRLDDVSLNLAAPDPYPYAPRMAISLTPYGQNPWRGPTLVHYAQPLAPHLAGAPALAQTYVNLHRDAQDEFHNRYGGLKGPIMPVHTRNDVENIPLCGCEDFGKFTWWPKYRNYGKVSAVWHFNESLKDAVNAYTLFWSSGNPSYEAGICQPGNTALVLDGSAHGSLASNGNLEPGLTDFSLTVIIKGSPQASGYQWLLDKMGSDGWVIQSKGIGDDDLQLKVTTSAGDSYSDITDVLDGNWHMLTWIVSFTDSKIYKVKDQTLLGYDTFLPGTGLTNTAYLNIGSGGIFSLDLFKYERRAAPAAEYENLWDIIRNGSRFNSDRLTGNSCVTGLWHFNKALTDSSGKGHTLSFEGGGSPLYPGGQAVTLDGSHYLNHADHADLNMGSGDFTLEVVFRRSQISLGYNARLVSKRSGAPDRGYELFIHSGNHVGLILADSSGWSTVYPAVTLHINDTANFHYLGVSVDRDGQVTFCLDGVVSAGTAVRPGDLDNSSVFNIGKYSSGSSYYFKGAVDLVRIHKGKALSAAELQANWQKIQWQPNNSAYPEVGCGLGQYWAFMRLAQYYFITGDPQAWEPLDHWLTWLETYAAADGPGWKFPARFSEYGFGYGTYDAGQTAAVALGCLYAYLRRGDPRAAVLARKVLDDLGANRWDPDYGGYRSDRHYGWLNGLVLQAFGLAVNGAAGQRYRFTTQTADQAHFETLFNWIMAHAGDDKPNVVNADLIPFTYSEAGDLWDYAPHYLAAGQMTTLEAVVLMLGGALEYGKLHGDWDWFNRLLAFMVADNLVVLEQSQLRRLTAACDQAGAANLVRLRYADHDRDAGKYCEVRDPAALAAWGEQAVDLDFRYGSPVILEDPALAQLLADRLLQRLGPPQEAAEAETWLEGARIELGDTVAVSSDFHGWDREEFTVSGKNLDLGRRRMSLKLSRPLDFVDAWAVEAAGSAHDAWAIDQDSGYDESWAYRALVN